MSAIAHIIASHLATIGLGLLFAFSCWRITHSKYASRGEVLSLYLIFCFLMLLLGWFGFLGRRVFLEYCPLNPLSYSSERGVGPFLFSRGGTSGSGVSVLFGTVSALGC
jgi:hypothetical protein